MLKGKTIINVRYAETDQMGYVHHGAYAVFLEEARINLFNDAGISYAQMEKEGVLLPVRSLDINYYSPAIFGDTLEVHTRLEKVEGVKAFFHYEVQNQQGVKVCEAKTTLVFVDGATRKPTRPTREFLEKVNNA